MFRVLYRKWRPRTFSDVYGQENVTKTLQNEVKEGRISHAYLFTGPRGVGKTTCAKILAKAVNCPNAKDGNPCNECDICKGIDNGSVLDVVEIDAASNRGIDDIRALKEETAFEPSQAKYRVYIIDEVHMLSIEAFNALLKTLEEPPEHVIFILATTEVQKLPATILSRCQRFDFNRLSVESIVSRLEFVAKNENIDLHDNAARLIARISDGGMRDALSLLDRCISISEDVTVDVVTKSAGMMDRTYLFNMSEYLRDKDITSALKLIDKLHSESCDTEKLCPELIEHFRNLFIVKTIDEPEKILACTDEELEELKKLSSTFSSERLLYILNVLQETSAVLHTSQSRRVDLELAVLKICSPELNSDISALAERISALEKEVAELKKDAVSFNGINNRSEKEEAVRDKKTLRIKSRSSVLENDNDKKNENGNDTKSKEEILSGISFDDDSADYDESDSDFFPDENENISSDEEPIFDEDTNDSSNFDVKENNDSPVFDEEEPVFDDSSQDPTVFDDENNQNGLVFDDDVNENAPEFYSENENNSDSADDEKHFNEFLSDLVASNGPFGFALMGSSHKITGDNINIHLDNPVKIEMIGGDEQMKAMRSEAENVFGRKMNIILS